MSADILLQAKNLCFEVPVPMSGEKKLLAEGIDLALHKGEIIGITGPNGAGKSTLLRLLSGYLAPSAGEITYGDQSLSSLNDRQRAAYVSFMSQKGPDTFAFSVSEIVEMGSYASLGRAPGAQEREAALKALETVGIGDLAERRFTTLSGGEQQLVMFAQVLMQDTPVILLDEPTSSLDIGHESQLLQMLRDLCREGRGVLTAVHNLNSAAEYCDRIIMLHQGRIVSSGTPREVFTEEHLRSWYQTEVRLGTNEATGSLVVTALPKRSSGAGVHVHLIGGAGSAVALTRELYLLGCTISGGAAHELDSDAKIWESLGAEYVTVPAFGEIDRFSFQRAEAMVKQADITILCSFPVGSGNQANLELAKRAKRLVIAEEPLERTFFTSEAQQLFESLKDNSPSVPTHDIADLVRELAGRKNKE